MTRFKHILVSLIACLLLITAVQAQKNITGFELDYDSECGNDRSDLDIKIEAEFFNKDIEIDDENYDVYVIKVFDGSGRNLIPASSDEDETVALSFVVLKHRQGGQEDNIDFDLFQPQSNPIRVELYEAVDTRYENNHLSANPGKLLRTGEVYSDCPGGNTAQSSDGRINNSLEMILYCRGGGAVEAWDVSNGEGSYAFTASGDAIRASLQQAVSTGQNVQIIAGPRGTGLWALSSFELQATLRDPARPEFNYIFAANRCGSWQGSAPAAPAAPAPSQPQPTPIPQPTATPTVSTSTNTDGAVQAAIASVAAQAAGTCPSPYIVQPEDNLFRIALNCGVDLAPLAGANGISDPTDISVGQTLTIPGR